MDGLITTAALGIVVLLQDCPSDEEADPTFFPSGTGVNVSVYGALADGESADGVTAYMLNLAAAGSIDSGLAAAGHSGTFTESGGMIYMVVDAEDAPVADATISCATPDACPAYYNTGLGEGPYGISFLDGTGVATTATGEDGTAVLPGAETGMYTVTHADLTYTPGMRGSLPGLAFFVNQAPATE